MSEKVKRLTPKKEVLRELYLKSGNECAFPNCHSIMINHDGAFIGQICHIEAANPKGERFNKDQNNEQRRTFENLMLMCYPHHTETNDVEKYPVQALQKIKKNHESKFMNILQKLQYSISDTTEENELQLCKTVDRITKMSNSGALGWVSYDSDEDLIKEINIIGKVLANLPFPTRQLFFIVVNRSSTSLMPGSDERLTISKQEIILATDESRQTIEEHLQILGRYELTCKTQYEEEIGEVVVSSIGNGWHFFTDLKEFCINTETELKDIIVNLNFSLIK